MGSIPDIDSYGHFLLVSWLGWGHLRPESAFAVAVARKFPHLIITRLTQISYTAKVQSEMDRQCTEEERATILPRIRLVGLGKPLADGPPHDQHAEMMSSGNYGGRVTGTLEAIMKDDAFTDDNGGSFTPAGHAPTLVIGDILMGEVVMPIMDQYGLPALIWFWGSSASSLTRFIAPRKYGGQMEWEAEVEAAFADPKIRQGRDINEVAYEYAEHTPHADEVVQVKGLQDTYQWENHPQRLWSPTTWDLRRTLVRFYHKAQGVLIHTTSLLDPEGVKGLEEFYCDQGKRVVITAGPLLPVQYFELPTQQVSSFGVLEVSLVANGSASKTTNGTNGHLTGPDPCLSFLDAALVTYGAQCGIFISFGTIHTPSVPRPYLVALLEALLELEHPMPFILSMASAANIRTLLPPYIFDRVEQSGKGLIVGWAPQQAIFSHAALGWVLTHGGGNTTMEALGKGLPMICWPIWGDQPVNSLWVSQTLEAGFELLEVRTAGVGKKAWRRGPEGAPIEGTVEKVKEEMKDVLQKCRDDEGKAKRWNAMTARAKILKSLEQGGEVDRQYEKLAAFF